LRVTAQKPLFILEILMPASLPDLKMSTPCHSIAKLLVSLHVPDIKMLHVLPD